MSYNHEHAVRMQWAGLEVLERLAETGAELSSEEIGAILETRSVKGVGAALAGTRATLARAGIRFDEAASKRSVRRRNVWTGRPRIRQAIHVLKQERFRWTSGSPRNAVPVIDAEPDYPGAVLALRALSSRGNDFRFDGGMSELDNDLNDYDLSFDELLDDHGVGKGSIEDIYAERIETGRDGPEHRVPDGYGENGIWTRGYHDYSHPQVAGSIGTGRNPIVLAWIGEARLVERRVVLNDTVPRIVAKALAEESWSLAFDRSDRWSVVEEARNFRYARWIASYANPEAGSPPPLRMRLRCWREIVIETAGGKRIILRAEGLRGDDARTTIRAIDHWRSASAKNAAESISVREIRIAKRQPRPMPLPEATSAVATPGLD